MPMRSDRRSIQRELDRRAVLKALAAAGTGAMMSFALRDTLAAAGGRVSLPFANGERELVAFPQKRPMILLSSRPPQLETPFPVFNEGVMTPNDAFFVRYHWSGIPLSVDPKTYRLRVGGKVDSPATFSLDELKRLAEPIEVIAVNQCSGNGRGNFMPRVNGGQLANGAMGNARWSGVPLKAVLEKAGVQSGALQVSFDGLDHPPLNGSPDFVKSLAIDHALDGEVMLAWAMNGEDLPMLNGFPLRLVVPGYYGTYWVKHVSDIQVLDTAFEGYWVSKAYRIPDDACACIEPGQALGKTVPISRMNVRSFITSLTEGQRVAAGKQTLVKGIAFDGGYGITEVALSADGGRIWREARLGKDLGRYSFREWTAPFTPQHAGPYELRVRAVNRIGQSQPTVPLWNPMGYMRNVVETTHVLAA